jgi:hypothetical protein
VPCSRISSPGRKPIRPVRASRRDATGLCTRRRLPCRTRTPS